MRRALQRPPAADRIPASAVVRQPVPRGRRQQSAEPASPKLEATAGGPARVRLPQPQAPALASPSPPRRPEVARPVADSRRLRRADRNSRRATRAACPRPPVADSLSRAPWTAVRPLHATRTRPRLRVVFFREVLSRD